MSDPDHDNDPPCWIDLEEIYRLYWLFAIRLACSYLASAAEAEDVAQDAIVVLWNRSKKERIRSPKAYLSRTIRNLSKRRNELGARLGKKVPESPEELADPSPVGENPEEEEKISTSIAELQEDFADPTVACEDPEEDEEVSAFMVVLREEIKKLPEGSGKVAWARFVDRKTPREIEKELGITDVAYRQRFSRARAKLEEAGLLYRAQKILVSAPELSKQAGILLRVKGKSPEETAQALGLTYRELGEILRDEDFQDMLDEIERFRDKIDESHPPKKGGKAED